MRHFAIAFAARYRYPELDSVPVGQGYGGESSPCRKLCFSPAFHLALSAVPASRLKSDYPPFLHPGFPEGVVDRPRAALTELLFHIDTNPESFHSTIQIRWPLPRR